MTPMSWNDVWAGVYLLQRTFERPRLLFKDNEETLKSSRCEDLDQLIFFSWLQQQHRLRSSTSKSTEAA